MIVLSPRVKERVPESDHSSPTGKGKKIKFSSA
jgi:hypothetical protein